MELSIVIPAYNESRKVSGDVAAASEFLTTNGLSGEVVIADDGSTDGTADIAQAAAVAPGVKYSVLRLVHGGKGWAVSQGILHSRGQYVLFADSGVCIPFADALPALALLRDDRCDIANGSRRLPESVIGHPLSRYRRVLSRLFRWIVLRVLHLPRHLTDTQCGFKLYKGHIARELYAQCRTKGFLFDLEILVRAAGQDMRVAEFPVHWRWDNDSRLRPARILWNVLKELIRIRRLRESE